jgi:hypothetical protein
MSLLQAHRQRQRQRDGKGKGWSRPGARAGRRGQGDAAAGAAAPPAAADGRPSLAQELVEEALVARAEADLRWLDRCEQRLLAQPGAAAAGASGMTATGAARRKADRRDDEGTG